MNNLWARLSRLPAGKSVFSKALGMRIPYTGTIHPEVLIFSGGHAKVRLRDRHRVRNHLKSIHAVALMNVCELTSGLAMTSAIPDGRRIILKSFQIEYPKKARGNIIAEATCPPNECATDQDFSVEVTAKNEIGEVVAVARSVWRAGPVRPPKTTP